MQMWPRESCRGPQLEACNGLRFPITMKHQNYMAEICFDRFWFSRVPLFLGSLPGNLKCSQDSWMKPETMNSLVTGSWRGAHWFFFTLLLVLQVLWILLVKTVVTPALEYCFIKPRTLDISSELRNFKSDCENRVCALNRVLLVRTEGTWLRTEEGLLLNPSSAIFARSLEPPQTSSSVLFT